MKIKRVLPLLLFCFLTIGWTIEENFDSGTIGQQVDVEGKYITSGSKSLYDNTYAYSGSQSVRFEHDEGSDGFSTVNIGVDIPDVNPAVGTEMWMRIRVKLGDAGDNISGNDWSWAPFSCKFMRVRKRWENGYNQGYNSILGASSEYPQGSIEFSANGKFDQNQGVNTKLLSGSWYTVMQYVYFDEESGIYRMWIDGVLVAELTNVVTIYEHRSTDDPWQDSDIHSYAPRVADVGYLTYCWFWSHWNNGHPQNQYSWMDDLYISTDSAPDAGGGGGDTTDPEFVSSDPIDTATGIALTKDPILSCYMVDGASGIDQSSVNLSVGGFIETGDLNFSGDLSNTTSYLTLSDLNVSLTNSQVVKWSLGFADLAGNVATTESGSFTITEVTTSETVFASGDMGDRDNYTEYTSSRWDVYDDSGDNVYRINTTEFPPREPLGLGEYTLFSETYSNFDFTVEVQSNENLVSNTYADANIVLGYKGEFDYYFIMLNASADSSGVFRIDSSDIDSRKDVFFDNESLITDNDFHTVRVKLENQKLEVWIDGVLKMTVENEAFQAGQVGFGGYNDKASFDDPVITSLAGSQSSAAPPYLKWGES